MVQNNKILTVSYGTFSCTLEGFDDAFGTMKAIAEYFRDLASDDRYFGSEPPVPDTEMLARIAQREISRKVDARQEASGEYVLRASEAQAQLAPPPEDAIRTTNRETEPSSYDDARPSPDVSSLETAELKSPSVSSSTVASDGIDSANHSEQGSNDDDETEAVIPPPQTRQSLADVMAQTDSLTIPEFVAEPVDVPEYRVDSIARRLERIRAVVSRKESASPNLVSAKITDPTSHQNSALKELQQPDRQTEPTTIAGTQNQTTETLPSKDQIGSERTPEHCADALAACLSEESYAERKQAASIVPDKSASAPKTETETETGVRTETQARNDLSTLETEPREVEREKPEHQSTATNEGEARVVSEEKILDSIGLSEVVEENNENPEQSENASPSLDAIEAISRAMSDPDSDGSRTETRPKEPLVIKVKRSDFEAALEAGSLEEVDPASNPATSLSAEDEDELVRELARIDVENPANAKTETEALDTFDISQESDIVETEVSPKMASSDEANPDDKKTNDEDELTRLMTVIEERMEIPDTSSIHNTYSQLRAAVSETKETERTEAPDQTSDSSQAYREDLAQAIRPKRPIAIQRDTEKRVGEARPAPLKLAAEHRVDRPQNTKKGPVRPRRVAAEPVETTAAEPKSENGFAEFASSVKAKELPELLEAAAAYLVFVEGRAQFSRPQLMNRVRQVDALAFDREAGLRSFGHLLREGKIEKSGGGRFTASSGIGFRPDARVAG